jgi:transcriptional regulator with XRE-family HTH domain
MKNWTEESTANFRYRVAFDFIEDLQSRMDKKGLSQAAIAKLLNISEGRVSQVFHNPGNLTIDTMIEYARALEVKLSIVAYDDGDKDNKQGLIPAEIFRLCWEKCGTPSSMWDIEEKKESETQYDLRPSAKISLESSGTPVRYQTKVGVSKKKGNEFRLAA